MAQLEVETIQHLVSLGALPGVQAGALSRQMCLQSEAGEYMLRKDDLVGNWFESGDAFRTGESPLVGNLVLFSGVVGDAPHPQGREFSSLSSLSSPAKILVAQQSGLAPVGAPFGAKSTAERRISLNPIAATSTATTTDTSRIVSASSTMTTASITGATGSGASLKPGVKRTVEYIRGGRRKFYQVLLRCLRPPRPLSMKRSAKRAGVKERERAGAGAREK
jgi:hypothetical protein